MLRIPSFALLLCLLESSSGFVTNHPLLPNYDWITEGSSSSIIETRIMVGGKGWENQNFLDSLGGDEGDRADAAEDYKDFKESRAAFMERQKKIMENPQAIKFMQERAKRDIMSGDNNSDDEPINMDNMMMDPFGNDEANVGSGGGTRFRRMMGVSRLQQQRQQQKEEGLSPDQFNMFEDDDKE